MRHTLIASVVLALFATAALAAGDTGIGKGSPAPAKVASTAAPVSGMMMVHHRVADYAKWRPVFDGHKSMQQAAGLTNPHVWCGKNDNDVYITFDMADEAKAQEFANSKDLRETMKKAGVEGRPTITYLTPAK